MRNNQGELFKKELKIIASSPLKIQDAINRVYEKATKNMVHTLEDDDFEELSRWMNNKTQTDNSWSVPVSNLVDYNLDLNNPNTLQKQINKNSLEYIDGLIRQRKQSLDILIEIKNTLKNELNYD